MLDLSPGPLPGLPPDLAPASLLYRRVADHYRQAITSGTLAVGERMPSVRQLMQVHGVSLSTALQACRYLEDGGWVEARPRSGYYVRTPRRQGLPPIAEPGSGTPPDVASYVGIHARVSAIVARGEAQPVHCNLALAVGAAEMYPSAALHRAAAKALREQPTLLTTMARRHGHPDLKAALTRRALAQGIQAAPQEVVVTHGCIEALNLALRAVADPGDTIAVESPTFYGVLQILESLGLRALEIPCSPRTGLSLEALSFALAQPGHQVKAVVCMPNLHNPTGSVMPDAHKEQLVRLCEVQGLALIEDDIYGALSTQSTPLKAAKAWDRQGHVIYCNSLNKVLAPGLRLGWMLPGRWQARVEMLKYTQSRYSEELPQIAVASFLASGAYDRHLQQLRQRLTHQRERVAEAVAAHFPPGTRLSLPEGGMLLWVELPAGVDGAQLFEAALAEGIKISPGSMFSNHARFQSFIRLSCAQPWQRATHSAVQRLGQLADKLAQGAPVRP